MVKLQWSYAPRRIVKRFRKVQLRAAHGDGEFEQRRGRERGILDAKGRSARRRRRGDTALRPTLWERQEGMVSRGERTGALFAAILRGSVTIVVSIHRNVYLHHPRRRP